MTEEMEYVHHPLDQAVHNLACLAHPITKMKGLVDNLYKDAEEQIAALMKEHKVLEIIKNKGLSTNELWFIKNDKTFEEYIETMRELCFGDEGIEKELKTKDEYDLLKEGLK